MTLDQQRQPPERECCAVSRDLDRIERDRAVNRRQRNGHEPALPARTQHDHIGIDGIAQLPFGQSVGIQHSESRFSRQTGQSREALANREIGIAVP